MIDEQLSLKDTFTYLIRQPDGRVCIGIFIIAIALIVVNIVSPFRTSPGSGDVGKWVTVWVLMPFISFLILTRLRQLIEGESASSQWLRSAILLAPVTVLFYFNFLRD